MANCGTAFLACMLLPKTKPNKVLAVVVPGVEVPIPKIIPSLNIFEFPKALAPVNFAKKLVVPVPVTGFVNTD